ncbi:MAG: hypothetical protein Q4F37_04975 [Corynebacterium sp.]|nr:hypothetical protein [Corynebacterium sp.]
MSTRAIVPVQLSLTEGDFYTLWAPTWKEHGSQWQAFLGDDTHVLLFHSPAELLTFLDSGAEHDLRTHPEWEAFAARDADRVIPADDDVYDVVGAPALLAERPSYLNVSELAGVFEVTNSLATVADAEDAVIFFASHSVLRNVERGSDHFAGDQGASEWSGVGRVVLSNWNKVLASLDSAVRVLGPADFDADDAQIAEAQTRIDAAVAAAQEAAEEARRAREAAQQAADPYDSSPWAAAGIDPVKISIQGKSLYTLRTYLGARPVFLGRYGEIFTFPSTKQLLRWMLDNDEHDLAEVATWQDLVTSATAGELIVSVHRDNSYSFTGLTEDIEKGPEAVDTEQMNRAYELMADAADWAADDSLNSYLLANPRFQDYLSYMLGSTESSGYVPSRPYTDKAEGWKALEDMLIKRFSKF